MKNSEILKKIFNNYLKNTGKTKFFIVLLFWLLSSVLMYLEPIFFTQVIKTIESFLQTWNFELNKFINLMLAWWIFIIVSTLIMVIYRYHFIAKTVTNNYVKLTNYYADKIINMSYPTYLSKEVWKIYKRFDRWLLMQYEFFMFFLWEFVKSSTWITFVIIILFYTNVKMALITLSLLPVMIILWIIFYKKLFPTQEELNKKWDSIYSDLWNIMSVFSLVKTLWIEKLFNKKINDKLIFCYSKQLHVSKWWTVADLYTAFFTTLSRFIVLWIWVYFVTSWEITFATLFLFFSYIGWIYFPMWFLFSRLWSVQSWMSAIWIFYKEFDNLESEYDNDNWIKTNEIKWEIEFKNVSFSYTKTEVIKNMSFKVKPWDKVAFVWNTWAGKSTIINLFLRFWWVDSWKILLDNININDLNLKSFRKHIWIVSQDNSLFNLTIRENLLFANKNATNTDLEIALKKAEADFVLKLEKWLDSVIWERWLKLSGWEKQRLSIARLFLKNPEILILDEATSALDNRTEKLIQKALDTLMVWRTSIVIAHRLSTIKHVDKIFVLKKWKIVEEWNYDELMNNKWEFFKLVNPDSLIIN